MKKTLFSLLVSLGSMALFAQDNCSKFYPMNEGANYEYTMFNKKNKVDGTTTYKVASVTNEGGTTLANMQLELKDKKGKDTFASDYNISCSDGAIRIDFKSLFPTSMMQQYEDMGAEIEMDGTDIEVPNDLSVGETLADANVAIKLRMTGINMNISVNMTDRKVEKKEPVTTAAGTFDCFLITETNTTKTMGASHEMHTKLWLAEGVGMIKQETYKKNGTLMGKTELTRYTK